MHRSQKYLRRVVDPVNSVAWYAMDAFWLGQLMWPAFLATALTLLTGALLPILNRHRPRRLNEDLALNAWMWMNALWLISDLGERPILRYFALGIGAIGAVLLLNSIRTSAGVGGNLRHFTKMRVNSR